MLNKNFPENRAFCEIMLKNVVEPERPQTIYILLRMRFACWVRLDACTHTSTRPRTHTHGHTEARTPPPALACTHAQKHVILIAFPRQQ